MDDLRNTCHAAISSSYRYCFPIDAYAFAYKNWFFLFLTYYHLTACIHAYHTEIEDGHHVLKLKD